jgi:hypothetical protein
MFLVGKGHREAKLAGVVAHTHTHTHTHIYTTLTTKIWEYMLGGCNYCPETPWFRETLDLY